jgi:hypothetical protein
MESKTVQRLEVVDDFIRNYLIKNKMTKSLEVFQQEYYELHKKGQPVSSINVPDVYIRNEKLEEQINYLSSELDKARIMAEKAKFISKFAFIPKGHVGQAAQGARLPQDAPPARAAGEEEAQPGHREAEDAAQDLRDVLI